VTGPIAEQELLATVTDLPPVVLDPPERLTLTAGKPTRLRVLVTRFDGVQAPLTFEADPPLPGVELQNNVMQPNANQIELRVVNAGAVKPGRFRLRAGPGVSPPIEMKVAGAKSEDADESRP
ncbi:MAG: hypothetical protein HY238_21225, partial [Acidobacteria bacterium]|nr:hypothetical protein [Acidobacteriota bacterium]